MISWQGQSSKDCQKRKEDACILKSGKKKILRDRVIFAPLPDQLVDGDVRYQHLVRQRKVGHLICIVLHQPPRDQGSLIGVPAPGLKDAKSP